MKLSFGPSISYDDVQVLSFCGGSARAARISKFGSASFRFLGWQEA